MPEFLGSNHGQDKGRSSPSPTGSMIISAGKPAGLPGLRGSDSIPPHSVCGEMAACSYRLTTAWRCLLVSLTALPAPGFREREPRAAAQIPLPVLLHPFANANHV